MCPHCLLAARVSSLLPCVPLLQVKDWAPKIEGIVEWFGQLQEVDVEGVPPALRAEVETENFLREDLPRQYEQR